MDSKQSSLYKQHILDHYKNPRNSGRLSVSTHHGEAVNKSCGDEVYLDLNTEDGVITEVGYEANGCAICIASMSMLSEMIKGKNIEEVSMIKDEDILEKFGMKKGSGRVKCALISKHALFQALDV